MRVTNDWKKQEDCITLYDDAKNLVQHEKCGNIFEFTGPTNNTPHICKCGVEVFYGDWCIW